MAWVRYDDQFPTNRKVTSVIAEDPGALSLHVLANTWSNAQKHPGFVPAHQPGILVCDRALGAKWAAVLVHANLWHERGQECDRCRDSYAHAPDESGFVFHDAEDYRPPARERQTPGTSEELSAKRRAAGRRGGRAAAAKQTARANVTANQANGAANQAKSGADAATHTERVSTGESIDGGQEDASQESPADGQTEQPARAKPANRVSKPRAKQDLLVTPVPEPGVCSNEQTPPSVGVATTSQQSSTEDSGSDAAPRTAARIVAAFMDGATSTGQDKPTGAIVGRVARDAKRLLGEKVDFDKLLLAAHRMGRAGWSNLDVQLQRLSAERNGQGSRASPSQWDSRTVSTDDQLAKWEPDEIVA